MANTQVLIGVVVLKDNNVIANAVSGEREVNSGMSLSLNDKWHIGSISKSFTATLLGHLVDAKILHWDDTLVELFPEFVGLHEAWYQVTLHQLLTHTSGVKPNFPLWVMLKQPAEGKERTDARLTEVKKILSKAPVAQAGTEFIYSNVGFTIAGVIAEEKTGKTWENLVREYIFAPLKLTSGGFGPPKDKSDSIEQPRGHHKKLFGGKKSVGLEFDNSSILGPAATIHMSLVDLAKYTNDHMQGDNGTGVLLKKETYETLHTAELENYAYGWFVYDEPEWASGPTVWHNGSNTAWFAFTVFMPALNTVVSIGSNDCDIETAEELALDVVKQIALKVKDGIVND